MLIDVLWSAQEIDVRCISWQTIPNNKTMRKKDTGKKKDSNRYRENKLKP